MKRNRNLFAGVVFVGVAMLIAAQPAVGAIIAYDGLSGYTAPAQLPDQTMSGTGFGGGAVTTWQSGNLTKSNVQIKAGGLTYGSLTVSGDQQADQVLANGYVRATLTNPINTGTVYMSVLAMAPTVKTTNGSWGPYVTINFENVSAFVAIPHDDAVHLAVIRLDLGTLTDASDDTCTTWLDPVPGSTEASNSGVIVKDNIAISGGGWNGTLTAFAARGGWDLDWDEVRFGDTFADVTPVPEPATMALLGVGGLLALGRKRRNA